MTSLPTYYQQFIHKSRYARYFDGKGRESWEETVDRYINNVIAPRVQAGPIIKELRDAILDIQVLPSMRGLMTAGPALDRDNVCLYNCSYLVVDDIKSFDEAMFILLCGTGVGFSVERQYTNKLPEIPVIYDSETVVVVKDSKEGWAKAFRQLIALLYAGEAPKWDLTRLRPAGARLKTFGGRASGPGPLNNLFEFTVNTFKTAQGRKLNSLECHDLMCYIAQIVVVGGVRRSALISLSNLSDDRLRHAKSGNWYSMFSHRELANNSVCYTEKPDMETFMREWLSLVESKSGERGIFNRVAAKAQAAKNGRRDINHDFGCNPCCVAPETYILTNAGYKPIVNLVDEPVKVWNGENWAEVIPYAAGEANLVRVELTDGTHLDCTWNHRWCIDGKFVTTDELSIGDCLSKYDMPVINQGNESDLITKNPYAYSRGFYAGDGNEDYEFSWIYEPKFSVIPNLIGSVHDDETRPNRKRWKHPSMVKFEVPLNESTSYKLNWLAGLLDADGCVTKDKNGAGFQIASTQPGFLEKVRLMLTTLGVQAKVVSGQDAGMRSLPDGQGGYKEYFCNSIKRLLIGNTDSYRLVNNLNLGSLLSRVSHPGTEPQRDARQFVRVKSIISTDRYEMTYCFTEPKTSRGTFNGIVTGNSEIILRPNSFCNLSEVVVRAEDTIETLKNKVRLATILGTIQATYTKFPYLRSIWRKNAEEERLLGVSLTGNMDSPLLNITSQNLSQILLELKQVAIQTNQEWASYLGIDPASAITCVKPSGTASQLVDCASGIHPRHSDYYIRTVRGDNKDPLTQFLIEKGIPNEPSTNNSSSVTVFSFPIKSPIPGSSITRKNISAIEQLEYWLTFQEAWCEHKPSVTINVRDHEWLEVGAFVYKNFDRISGVSFLPFSDHSYKQAPYQECTLAQYEELLAKMPQTIDWEELNVFESTDNTASSQSLACTGDVCELVDITR